MIVTTALLLASIFTATPTPDAPADVTIGFSQSMSSRHARLLEGLELAATYKLSESPVLRLTDSMRFALSDLPRPLDFGGGARVDSETRQVLALVLGLVVGFGIGHLVAQDRDGFILFLVVDVAIIVASSVLTTALNMGVFWAVGGVALLVSHVFQALDAYSAAGGSRIVEFTRQRAVQVADVGSSHASPAITTRAFGFSF